MNDTKIERLARILGLVDDDLVIEAANVRKRYLNRILRWSSMAAAACLCVVIIAAVALSNMRMGRSGNGTPTGDTATIEAPTAPEAAPADAPEAEVPEVNGIGPNADAGAPDGAGLDAPEEMPAYDNGETDSFCADSILPLSLAEYSEGVTAERETTLDFSPYLTRQGPNGEAYDTSCLVTDNYILTNNTDSDISCIALYYISSASRTSEEGDVEIYVSGAPVETRAYPEARMNYQSFELTIPARESVSVTVELTKDASYNDDGPTDDGGETDSFYLAAVFGSNLNFTSQSVTLEDRGIIEIMNQNFGFDIENGIKTVELDLNTERYYIEIVRKK